MMNMGGNKASANHRASAVLGGLGTYHFAASIWSLTILR
jgi:hypothetical protein